jgi:hypothetical protein
MAAHSCSLVSIRGFLPFPFSRPFAPFRGPLFPLVIPSFVIRHLILITHTAVVCSGMSVGMVGRCCRNAAVAQQRNPTAPSAKPSAFQLSGFSDSAFRIT